MGLGLRADVGDVRGGGGDRLTLDEHRLGVARRVRPAAVGGAGLEEHGRALRRGRHGEDAVRPLVLAVDLDAVQLLRVGVQAPRAVAPFGVVVPAVLPEPQARVEEVIGGVVALVVRELLRHAEQLVGGGLGASRDDVPADAAVGEPVEGREAPGGGVGLFDRGRRGDDEADVLGRPRERRDREHRVEGGELDAVGGDFVRHPPLEGRVPVCVGEEEEVEPRLVEHGRQVDPVVEAVPVVAAAAWVGPGRHPVAGVHHFERAQQNRLRRLAHRQITIATVLVSR